MDKKLLFSVIVFVISITNTNSQVASSDAESLSNIPHTTVGNRIKFNPKDSLRILPILLNYVNPKPKTFKELGDALSTNPFIDIIGTASMSTNGTFTKIFTGAKSSVLNTPVTDFADGLAKFLVKRAKQELLISFFNKLRDDTKNPEFAILFPNSKRLVDNFESWQYANIINTLREALTKDLKLLMGNIPNLKNLKDNDDYSESVKKRVKAIRDFFTSTDEGRILVAALNIGNGFSTSQKIPDIIHSITDINSLAGISTLTTDQKNIIRLLDILSYSVRSNEYGNSYISQLDFTTLLSNNDKKNLFLGLLYQQLKNENITINGIDIAGQLVSGTKIQDAIKSMANKANGFSDALKKVIEARKKGETDLSSYWPAVFENGNTFFQSVSVDLKSIDNSFALPESFNKTLNMATSTIEIANEIVNKNYSAAIVSILTFISDNVPPRDGEDFKSFFVKYGSFAANVAQAENSEEVEEAIESVALPVGSASIKKKTCFSIALNAYLGGFYGNEYLADKTSGKWAPISGVYAPVGVTFSWGLNFDEKNYGSLSALINIIDIGAIASYRLQDEETEKLPEITLQNILAPGLGLVYGFPDFPLSLGWSYQFGPALREINATEAITDQINRRWQLFLAVDIPIFNLYTRTK